MVVCSFSCAAISTRDLNPIYNAFEDLFALPEELASDLLPYPPKFHHALLDLTRFDPTTGENDTRLKVGF